MSPTQVQAPLEQQAPDPVALFGDGLKKLVNDDIRTDLDPEKVYQLSDIRKFEYYWRGIQFLRRTMDGGTVNWAPVNAASNSQNGNSNAEELYNYYTNDIRGYGRKFIGVIAQQPPNVKFRANKATSQEHVRRSKKAQSVGDILRGLWDIKYLSQQAAGGFWKSGTQFIYTPFVADEDKYGATEEQVLEDQQVQLESASLKCPNCGQSTPMEDGQIPPRICPGWGCGRDFGPEDFVEPESVAFPMPTGKTEKYPNGCAEAHLYNGMYVSTPFWIRMLRDTPWLILEYEEYKGKILMAYRSKPEIYKKLREMADGNDSGGSSGGYAETIAKTTRDLAQSPSGTVILPHRNRWLYSRIWMRPSEYELAKGEIDVDGELKPLRDALLEKYPTGLRLTIVQDKVIEIEPEILDYVWVMGQPEFAENAFPDPLCKDLMSSQDLSNMCLNVTGETLERQIPQTGIDVDMIDLNARKKHQLPASFIPMRRKSGQSLKDSIVTMAVAKTEPEMTDYPNQLREHAAETVGITRAIFGAGEKEQTAYATNLKRNQAMLQLSPALDALRKLIAGAEQNGVMQMALHSGGRIPSPYAPRTESEDIDGIEELAEGGWHAEPEDTMPQGWSERRAALQELMEKNPEALAALGFMEIDNIPIIQDTLVGLPDWKIPNSDVLNKVNRCILELLQGEALEKPSMQVPGKMIQIPSVPVDEWDDHQFFSMALVAWLMTEDAAQERIKNRKGFDNVCAFWKCHKGQAITAMAQQAQQDAAGSGPPAEKGAPQKLAPPPGGDSPEAAQHAIQ